MIMSSLNVSISESLREFVNQRVVSAGYSTPSEYIRQLIREDQKAMTRDQLEALLLEGLQSGEPTEMMPQTWADIRQRVQQRIQQKKSQ